MKKYILLSIFVGAYLFLSAQKENLHFTGGIQYGISVNTIYKYTEELGYFDAFNYGKKLTPTFGFYASRGLSKTISFEIALLYHKRGTRYQIYYSPTKKLRYSSYGQILDLHYASIPIIIQKNLNRTDWLKSLRYGVEMSSLFFVNMPQVQGDGWDLYQNYDYSGLLGLKLKPSKLNYFRNKAIIVDFRFSILPIMNEDYNYLLETAKDFSVLPNQRNYSISITLQHNMSKQ